jgi:outer membrane receptor protein involved in Fe transport
MLRHEFTKRFLVTTSSIGLALSAVPAIAADADGPGASAAEAAVPAEIVVTAEKRGSTIQKTPISISAFSGAALQAQGSNNIAALAGQVPSLAVKSSGPGQTEFTLRGLSSPAGVAPTVGFYLDEIPISPPAIATAGKVGIDPNLYDLARVEVLRGPQGTLYGASSMGGTIKLVPNAPDPDHFEGSIDLVGSATQSGGANGTAKGMVNIPIVEGKVALRVVGTLDRESGWLDRVVLSDFPVPDASGAGGSFSAPRGDVQGAAVAPVHRNDNSADMESVRAALLIQPSERLSITPSIFYQRIHQANPDTYDNPPGTNAHYQPFDIAEPFIDRFAVESLKITYDLGFADLTSATGATQRHRRQVQDSSELLQKFLADFAPLPGFDTSDGGIGAGVMVETEPSHQFTQELRLASKSDGRFRWLVGAFYSRFTSKYQALEVLPRAAPIFGTSNIFTAAYADKLQQIAGFTNLSYDVTPKLKATAGVRYFHSWDSASGEDSGLFSTGVVEPTTAHASGANPMANLSWSVTPDHMVYATAAKGFRDGAAQLPVPSSCDADLAHLGLTEAPTRFGPDSVWSYELGTKNRFLDRRLTVNVAGYLEKWDKVQQTIILPTCGFARTANASNATIKGLEFELSAQLTDTLGIDQSLSYTHARFDDDNIASGTTKGEELLNVPEWTASGTLRYDRPIGSRYHVFARATASYVGPSIALTSQRERLPDYTLIGIRGGLRNDSWSATLFIDNLTNKRAALNNAGSLTLNVPGLDRVVTNRPRTFGIDLSTHF